MVRLREGSNPPAEVVFVVCDVMRRARSRDDSDGNGVASLMATAIGNATSWYRMPGAPIGLDVNRGTVGIMDVDGAVGMTDGEPAV